MSSNSFQLLTSASPHWQKDSDAVKCPTCSADFSVTTRRHHCRLCGFIFCAPCSSFPVTPPGAKERLPADHWICFECAVQYHRLFQNLLTENQSLEQQNYALVKTNSFNKEILLRKVEKEEVSNMMALTRLREAESELRDKIEQLTEDVDAANAELQKSIAQLEERRREKEEVMKAMKVKDVQLQEWQGKYDQKLVQLKEVTSENTSLKQELASLNKIVATHSTSAKQGSKEEGQKQRELEVLRERNMELNTKLQQMVADLKNAKESSGGGGILSSCLGASSSVCDCSMHIKQHYLEKELQELKQNNEEVRVRLSSTLTADSNRQQLIEAAMERLQEMTPYLGFNLEKSGVNVKNGIEITAIAHDSPAALGGLLVGDTIEAINGVPTPSQKNLMSQVWNFTPGDQIAVQVFRKKNREKNILKDINLTVMLTVASPHLGINEVATIRRLASGIVMPTDMNSAALRSLLKLPAFFGVLSSNVNTPLSTPQKKSASTFGFSSPAPSSSSSSSSSLAIDQDTVARSPNGLVIMPSARPTSTSLSNTPQRSEQPQPNPHFHSPSRTGMPANQAATLTMMQQMSADNNNSSSSSSSSLVAGSIAAPLYEFPATPPKVPEKRMRSLHQAAEYSSSAAAAAGVPVTTSSAASSSVSVAAAANSTASTAGMPAVAISSALSSASSSGAAATAGATSSFVTSANVMFSVEAQQQLTDPLGVSSAKGGAKKKKKKKPEIVTMQSPQ